MGKAKTQEGSISGWFRDLYRKEPKWLKIRSNQDVIQRWKDEHGGEEFGKRQQEALANVKSSEKKAQGIRKKRGPKPAAAAGSAGAAPQTNTGRGRSGGGDLEDLEEAIDRCLSRARHFEEREEGMHNVVRHLRAARNDLILLGK